MIRQGIALATSILTLAGMWLAGSHRWEGWLVGLLNQVLWIAFIVAFGAWGLLPLSLALIVVYTRNLVRWRSSASRVPQFPPHPSCMFVGLCGHCGARGGGECQHPSVDGAAPGH